MQFPHHAPTLLEALVTTVTPFTLAIAACNVWDIKALPILPAMAINVIAVT